MPLPSRLRARRFASSGIAALVAALVPVAAGCGASKPRPATPNAVPAPPASVPASAAPRASAGPIVLPGTGALDTPHIETSKRSRVTSRDDDAFASCLAATKTPLPDVVARAKDAVARCVKAPAKSVGDVLRAPQSAKAPPGTFPLRPQSKRCYRLVVAASADPGSFAVAVRDSVGDVAAETVTDRPLFAVPARGALCFDVADEATIHVGFGRGEGTSAIVVVESDTP
ncbi:MAG: hypothetical protein U0169_11995 [Polyangiaceae bacterium]